MPATVRFFCVVGPRPLAVNNKGLDEASLDATWGELSFAFLQALWNANIDVRAITIGASHIQRNDDHKRNLQWSHWQALSSAFVRDVGALRVNVVCSPLHLVMGTALTRRAIAPPPMPNVPSVRLDTDTDSAADDLIYHPSTAFSALWTDGLCNIAITRLGADESLSDAERVALSRYEHVLTPGHPEALRVAGLQHADAITTAALPSFIAARQA